MPEPIITPAFSIHACRGLDDCRHSAIRLPDFIRSLNECLTRHDLESELRTRIRGPLRHHHRLKISLSLCPNGCSQPQIADIGLIGATAVRITDSPCSGCGGCVDACREDGVTLAPEGPVIDTSRCLQCLACVRVCPEGTLAEARSGLRIQLGGKLGRHPMLGRELAGIHSEKEAIQVVDRAVRLHLERFIPGRRLGDHVRAMSPAEFEETFHP